MEPRRTYRIVSAVTLTALLTVVGACGNDDDSGSAEAPTTSATVPAGTEGAGSTPQPAAGEPIKVMAIGSYDNAVFAIPQAKTAVQARIDAINAEGGINGHPLEVVFCDDLLSPNGATDCGNEAASQDVVAVVGGYQVMPESFPALEEAGIPYIGGSGITPQELASPIAFPISSGVPGWYFGMAAEAVNLGLDKVAIIKCDNVSCDFAASQIEAGLQQGGLEPVRTVVAPLASPSFAAQATAAIEGDVNAVILAMTPDTANAVVKSLRQAGYDGVVLAIAPNFSPEAVADLGADSENLYLLSVLASPTNTDIPEVQQFLDEMSAADSGATIDEISMTAWTSVNLFADVAKTLDTVDAASVLEGFNQLATPVELGTTSPYVVVGATPPADHPRMFNPTVTVVQVQDGEPVQITDFVNPFEILSKP